MLEAPESSRAQAAPTASPQGPGSGVHSKQRRASFHQGHSAGNVAPGGAHAAQPEVELGDEPGR